MDTAPCKVHSIARTHAVARGAKGREGGWRVAGRKGGRVAGREGLHTHPGKRPMSCTEPPAALGTVVSLLPPSL